MTIRIEDRDAGQPLVPWQTRFVTIRGQRYNIFWQYDRTATPVAIVGLLVQDEDELRAAVRS